MKSKAKKRFHFLDEPSDMDVIWRSIDDYERMLLYLRGDNFDSHPAPDCMNRELIKKLKQRITFLSVKELAIEAQSISKSKTETVSLVQSKLKEKLKKHKVCDTDIPKFATLRKWIASDASEVYPNRGKG